MSFWDRIKRWFAGGEKPPIVTKNTPSKPPQPAMAPKLDHPDDGLPSPGDTPIDTFHVLFSNKDKHTTFMLNSISLSSDMKTLYLIDNGRAISFDLTVPQGVLVGLLGDQLVVATGSTLPVPQDAPDLGVAGAVEGGEVARTRPVEKKYTFKAGENSQYTVSYNGKHKAFGVIGIDDIVISIEGSGEGDPVCKEKMFSLTDRNVVRLLMKEDVLTIDTIAG